MAVNIDEAVEAATSKASFNVFEFVQGGTVPTDDIYIYTDADAALKLAKIFYAEEQRKKKDAEEGLSLGDETEDEVPEEVISALHERLLASRLTFHLKGLAPEAVRTLEANTLKKHTDAESEDFNLAFNHTLIAQSIVSVENPDGAVNTDKWTAKMVTGFLPSLYLSEASKLLEASAELSYIGAIFDRAVNADFS